jgi:3-oxoacyl-(acyl-carrier-protein) synthase
MALVPLASGCWPESAEDRLPALPGFIESTFSPLVAAAAERCLRHAHGAPPVPAERGARTALIISSSNGDVAMAARVVDAVAGGPRLGPLHFFQAVPNAVAGHVAARWGLGGPVVCLGSPRSAFDVANLLIADGDADEVLVICVSQSPVDSAMALLVKGAGNE